MKIARAPKHHDFGVGIECAKRCKCRKLGSIDIPCNCKDTECFCTVVAVDHRPITEGSIGTTVHDITSSPGRIIGRIAAGCGVGQYVVIAATGQAVVTASAKEHGTVGAPVAEVVCGIRCAGHQIKGAIAKPQFFNGVEGVCSPSSGAHRDVVSIDAKDGSRTSLCGRVAHI